MIAAALAKAGRTDPEAIALYIEASEKLSNYGEPASLYRLLKTLDGDEVKRLRRAMLKRHGTDALSQ